MLRKELLPLACLGLVFGVLLSAASAQDTEQTPYLCINIDGHTAPVRAMAFSSDSNRLFTAGLDKAVHVWRLTPGAQRARPEGTLRWDIGRGQRGSIYALAVAPRTGRVTIGGYGARATNGDLVTLAPDTGAIAQVRTGQHLQNILSLAYSASGEWLASIDYTGRVLLWPADGDSPRELLAGDREPALARPIAFVGDQSLLVPVPAGRNGGDLEWRIEQISVATGQVLRTFDQPHRGAVRALAASRDGRRFASSDESNPPQLLVWNLDGGAPQPLTTTKAAISLAFAPGGDTLVAGTAPAGEQPGTELQIWDLARGTVQRRNLEEPVYACAVSPDGRRLAYYGAHGHDVTIERLDAPGPAVQIAGGGQIAQVGVVRSDQGYATLFRLSAGAAVAGETRAFHAHTPEVVRSDAAIPEAAPTMGTWQYALDRRQNGVALFHNGAAVGWIMLDRPTQGELTACCWIPGESGEPAALAVGTNVQCGVFVYGLTPGNFPLLRYFRGHHDAVTTLAAAPDGRFLVSGARDGTIRHWPLAESMGGYRNEQPLARRWGVKLSAESGRLVVTAVDECSPLFHKFVRQNDTIDAIGWVEGGRVVWANEPQQIAGWLEQLPWNVQVSFKTSRNSAARPPFNLIAGWHELLSLYPTQREWIAWTPLGYYACSASGEQLIGWQFYNGHDEAPPLHPAGLFYQRFYKPDVIRGLLSNGSVATTISQLATTQQPPSAQTQTQQPPSNQQPAAQEPQVVTLADTHLPRVKIKSPELHDTFNTAKIVVEAQAWASHPNEPLAKLTLSVNGRPWGNAWTCTAGAAQTEVSYTWGDVPLKYGTSEIVVLAETKSGDTNQDCRVVECTVREEEKGRLYVVSVGVSQYQHYKKLDFAAADAQRVANVLDSNTRQLYDGNVNVRTLTDERATKGAIEQALTDRAQNAGERDVLIIYFAGHGVQRDHKFYFLPVDAREDLEQTALSGTRIKEILLKGIKAKKVLVIFDACDSGGAGTALTEFSQELKQPEVGVALLAASQGEEQALEDQELRGGVFTVALVEGLRGNAARRDSRYVYGPDEIATYVHNAVLKKTGEKQHPSCNARDLDDFPLTQVAAAASTP